MSALRLCTVVGCEKSTKTRRMCGKHYERWRHYGDPLLTARAIECRRRMDLFRSMAVVDTDDCSPAWPHSLSDGYPALSINGTWVHLHRLACELAHGPAPTPAHQAAHSCGNKGCVNQRHLRWATPKENEADKVDHGRTNRGSRCGTAKLAESQVDEIRHRRAAGEMLATLADEFGVAATTICAIARGRRWSHHLSDGTSS